MLDYYFNIVRLAAYQLVVVGLAISWLTDTPLGRWIRLELMMFFMSIITLFIMERFIIGSLVNGIPRRISTAILVVLALHMMVTQMAGLRLIGKWLRNG